MPGDWTVTTTRVIEDKDDGEVKQEARATGVRKREATEDQKEEEEAIQGLFKKPRRWGRDSKLMPQEEDRALDALLSGSFLGKKEPAEDDSVKKESTEDAQNGIKTEPEEEIIKEEPDGEPQGVTATVKAEDPIPGLDPPVKTEDGEKAAVVFKKRKPKGIRQK